VHTGKQNLWLADATGRNQTLFGTGITPFWLDENTVGYLQTGGRKQDANSLLVLATFNDSQTNVLLPAEAATSLLPLGMANREFAIRAINTSPAHPSLLLIAVAILDSEHWHDVGGSIFSYDLHEEKLRLLLNLPYNFWPYAEFSFSPDGELLSVRSIDHSKLMSQLHFHHLTNDQTILMNTTYPTAYPGYDWSASSQWVLRMEEGFLHLYAPTYPF
jgi:hypothetical protein